MLVALAGGVGAARMLAALSAVTDPAGITAVVDLVLENPERYRGFVAQEQFRMTDILANRFGRYYAPGGSKDVSAQISVTGQAGQQRAVKKAAAR